MAAAGASVWRRRQSAGMAYAGSGAKIMKACISNREEAACHVASFMCVLCEKLANEK